MPLDEEFVVGYRERCERMLRERPYDVALNLMPFIANHIEDVIGAVYQMWGELTDAFEFAEGARRTHAEALMREAASEALAMTDPDTQLDDWAAGWLTRIRRDPELRWTF